MWVVDRLEQKTKGPLKFFDDRFREYKEFNVWVLIVEVFGKLGDAFCVCLRLELETLALEKDLQFLVVGDDAIMNDGKFPARI